MPSPSLAAVCAVVFALAATGEEQPTKVRSAANDALGSIIDAAPDIAALDDEVKTIFDALRRDHRLVPAFIATASSPCVDYVKSLRVARYD